MTQMIDVKSDVGRLLNALGRPVYLKYLDDCFVHANDDFLAMFGCRYDHLIGRMEVEILGGDNAEILAEGAARLIAGRLKEHRCEITISDVAETIHLFEVRQRLYETADGNVLILVVMSDVTDQHHLEEVLRASEEYARSFLESSQDIVAHLSSEGSFLSINGAGMRMLGINSLDAIVGHSFDEIFPVNHIAFLGIYAQVLADGQVRFEQQVSRTDEHDLWLDMHFTPIRDIDGSLRSILLVGRDITDFKMIQSQLVQQEKMSSIGQLAAGVAHEINNPLGFITSNLNTLKKYVDRLQRFLLLQDAAIEAMLTIPSQVEKEVERLKAERAVLKIDFILKDAMHLIDESLDGSERVSSIVLDLKGFSRVDDVEEKLSDINAGLESTINIVWNEIKYKATVHKEYGMLPQTKCNLGQLNQVFMNILLNAVQAIPEHGEMRIKTWADEGRIFIAISDTGSGIAPDKIGRIFEPFFTTKEVGKGTGLGLSIAYDIVKKHGGEIAVQSEIGKGTTFTISIPVIEG
jgi:PAS domain S-box-containing protein